MLENYRESLRQAAEDTSMGFVETDEGFDCQIFFRPRLQENLTQKRDEYSRRIDKLLEQDHFESALDAQTKKRTLDLLLSKAQVALSEIISEAESSANRKLEDHELELIIEGFLVIAAYASGQGGLVEGGTGLPSERN